MDLHGKMHSRLAERTEKQNHPRESSWQEAQYQAPVEQANRQAMVKDSFISFKVVIHRNPTFLTGHCGLHNGYGTALPPAG